MLTRKTKYALRALVRLAQAKGGAPTQTSSIASLERIPKRFLEQILLELKAEGLVESVRGRHGGYALAVPASDISMARVVRAVDRPIALLPCVSITAYERCEECVDEASCVLRRVVKRVHAASVAILEHTTLAMLVADLPDDASPEASAHLHLPILTESR